MNCIRTVSALLVACAFTVVARAQDFSAIGVSRGTTGRCRQKQGVQERQKGEI